MSLSRWFCALCSCILVFMVAMVRAELTYGQSEVNGTITGTVTDSSESVVVGARITLINVAKGTTQESVTNDVGLYVITDLQPGIYNVSVKKDGFKECVGAGVVLQSAENHRFSCKLQLGSPSISITVDASVLQVESDEAHISREIDAKQIEDLPSNGRMFVNLIALQPGVAGISFDSMTAMNTFATQGLTVNGAPNDSNNILVDGVSSTRTRGNNALIAPPSQDAIDEVKIVSGGYLPEYSRGAGGQIIVRIKSGTDQYHGSLYEYNRNTVYDAKNFFATDRASITFNDFGGTVGGPVIPGHKKLFFFYSQEFVKWPGNTLWRATVPSALARTGNFSEYCAAGSGFSCPTVPSYLAGQTDPNTGQALVAGQLFPNDTIAKSFWSPNGAAFMNIMAAPSSGGISNNYNENIPNPQSNYQENLKIDYQIDARNHLSGSLRFYHNDTIYDWFAGSSQLFVYNDHLPARALSINFSTTITPTLINDFTFGYGQDINESDLENGQQMGLNRSSLGINFPYIYGDASKAVPGKAPTISVAGFDAVGLLSASFPSYSTGKIFQFQDIITKVVNHHILKFGAWIERDGQNDNAQVPFASQNANGFFSFNGNGGQNPSTTGFALADMLLGNFDSYTEVGYPAYTPWVAWQEGFFAQDTWKVKPNLTVQGGLRWDFYPPYHSSWCNFATFDPLFYSTAAGVQQEVATSGAAAGNVVGGNPYNGMAVPCRALPTSGYGQFGVFGEQYNASTRDTINQQLAQYGMLRGLPPGILPNQYGNFEPRLGFSWDPFGKGTTVVRGSGGIFYNHMTLSDQIYPGGNVPFQAVGELLGGVVDCPGSALSATRQCLGSASTSSLGTPPTPAYAMDTSGPIPAVYQWTMGLQHLLPDDMLLDVGYVGTRAHHLATLQNLNEMEPGTVQANPNVPIAALVPYAGFSTITAQVNEGNSSYDALQVSLQKRLKQGLMFSLAYTFANAFDTATSTEGSVDDFVVNHYNLAYSKGPSDYLNHHTLLFNYIYEPPVFRNRNDFVGRVLGGWQFGGVVTFLSGTPFSVTDGGQDISGLGFDSGERLNLVSGCNPNSGPKTGQEWFNTACFALPTPGTLGDAGRNDVWGPHTINFDFALFKNGSIWGEKLKYQFKAEAFNVFNHASFGTLNGTPIDTTFTDSTFGQVLTANDPRLMQLGLRIIF
jgi:hypothetical protein